MKLHAVFVLNILRLFVCFAVEVYDAVFNLQCLSRQTYTTLYIVLTTVGRTGYNISVCVRVVGDIASTEGVDVPEKVILLLAVQVADVKRRRVLLLPYLLSYIICKHVEILLLVRLLTAYGVA